MNTKDRKASQGATKGHNRTTKDHKRSQTIKKTHEGVQWTQVGITIIARWIAVEQGFAIFTTLLAITWKYWTPRYNSIEKYVRRGGERQHPIWTSQHFSPQVLKHVAFFSRRGACFGLGMFIVILR